MQKWVLTSFAFSGFVIGLFGMAAFGILLLDFQWPGLFKSLFVPQERMASNMALMIAFGVQHSVMARPGFKKYVLALFPPALERSFYVMMSGFMLLCLAGLWAPTTPPIYDFRGTALGWLMFLPAMMGMLILGWGAMSLGGLDLIGWRSMVWILRTGGKEKAMEEIPFSTPGPYKYVRHPLYTGMMLLFWGTPAMTHDHLLFAETMTAYLLIGTHLEERALLSRFGKEYADYRQNVGMFFPRMFKRS